MKTAKKRFCRRRWDSFCLGTEEVYHTKAEAKESISMLGHPKRTDRYYPVAVIDLSPDAISEMIELMRIAIGHAANRQWSSTEKPYERYAVAAIQAILGPLPQETKSRRTG